MKRVFTATISTHGGTNSECHIYANSDSTEYIVKIAVVADKTAGRSGCFMPKGPYLGTGTSAADACTDVVKFYEGTDMSPGGKLVIKQASRALQLLYVLYQTTEETNQEAMT